MPSTASKKLQMELYEILNKFMAYVNETVPVFTLPDAIQFFLDELVISFGYSAYEATQVIKEVRECLNACVEPFDGTANTGFSSPQALMGDKERSICGLQQLSEFAQFLGDCSPLYNGNGVLSANEQLYKLNNYALLMGTDST